MRHASDFSPSIRWLALSSCLIFCTSLAARQFTDDNATATGDQTLGVGVSDANTHARLGSVRLMLNSAGGPSFGPYYTRDDGSSTIHGIVSGSYTLVADKDGYRTVTEDLNIPPESFAEIELPRASDPGAAVARKPATVSARDLAIPHNAQDNMAKGMALLYGKSDYHGSVKSFEKATQDYPDYYEAYTQIGVAYMKLADTANSEKAFQKSIDVSHQQFQDAYIGLAELYLTGKRFADAEPIARKAVELDPNSWRAQSQLARTLVQLKRASEAEASAVAAVKLDPDNPTLYLLLANIHIELQNDRALLDDLNHYLKLAPDAPFAAQARQQRDELQKSLAALPSSPATSPPQH